MKIENVAFNLTAKDLSAFGLTLKDNDASESLTIGDGVENADKSVKPASENDLTTWTGMIDLLKSGGTQVVKTSDINGEYLCFGKTEVDGIIKLGNTSEFCNIESVNIKDLLRKWPVLAYMIAGRGGDSNAYEYAKLNPNTKKVFTSDANDRIADVMLAASLTVLNDDADEKLEKISEDFLNGSVDSSDISFVVSARKSFDEAVAQYLSR